MGKLFPYLLFFFFGHYCIALCENNENLRTLSSFVNACSHFGIKLTFAGCKENAIHYSIIRNFWLTYDSEITAISRGYRQNPVIHWKKTFWSSVKQSISSLKQNQIPLTFLNMSSYITSSFFEFSGDLPRWNDLLLFHIQ